MIDITRMSSSSSHATEGTYTTSLARHNAFSQRKKSREAVESTTTTATAATATTNPDNNEPIEESEFPCAPCHIHKRSCDFQRPKCGACAASRQFCCWIKPLCIRKKKNRVEEWIESQLEEEELASEK